MNNLSYENLQEYVETLRNLIRGECVDCDKVCEAMCIDFKEGIHMFDFGRQVYWNQSPLNGQRVITKFRVTEKTVQPAKDFITVEEYAKLRAEGCW